MRKYGIYFQEQYFQTPSGKFQQKEKKWLLWDGISIKLHTVVGSLYFHLKVEVWMHISFMQALKKRRFFAKKKVGCQIGNHIGKCVDKWPRDSSIAMFSSICCKLQRIEKRTYMSKQMRFPMHALSISRFLLTKETKRRSSGQTPFTIKPKQLALKKPIFNPQKILPKFF